MNHWGPYVAPIVMLLFIIGFHAQPALWVPLVLVFVAVWIMGVRSDRKRANRRRGRT